MSAPAVTVRCPAKLNLYLDVLARRPDGYHEIDTIIQSIDLYDDLTIEPGPGLTLACDDPRLPCDETNLVLRAAAALREATGHRGGAHFRLAKRIPSQAGLGGGSSDAAGALAGLDRLWGLGLSTEELSRIAAAVGSDVPFFLHGGTARCRGRGEQVEPLPLTGEYCYVVLCPPARVSTAEAYGKLHLPLTPAPVRASMLAASLIGGDLVGAGRGLYNRLEASAFGMHEALREAKSRLTASGQFVGVSMTGSGSAFFGLCLAANWENAYDHIVAADVGRAIRARGIRRGVAVRPG